MIQITKGNKQQSFVYDSLGRCIEENEGEVIHKTVYDALNRITQTSTWNSNGELQLLQEFGYDADGNKTIEKNLVRPERLLTTPNMML